MNDSAYKRLYNVVVRLYKLPKRPRSKHIFDSYYPTYLIGDLYKRFITLDTTKHYAAHLRDTLIEYDSLRELIGKYVDRHIASMSDTDFDAFIRLLDYEKCETILWTETNNELRTDMALYYSEYLSSLALPEYVEGFTSGKSRKDSNSSGYKGHGGGGFIYLFLQLIYALVDAGDK